jgi:hypothetical protein
MVFSQHQRAPLLPRLTPGQYRDPVCGMRTDEDGPIVTHDGERITSAQRVASVYSPTTPTITPIFIQLPHRLADWPMTMIKSIQLAPLGVSTILKWCVGHRKNEHHD